MSRRNRPVGEHDGTYTRSPMDTGTLGTRRPLNLDAMSAEASTVVAGAADRLRELSQLLRDAYEEAVSAGTADEPSTADLAQARELLGRLELAESGVRASQAIVAGEPEPAPDAGGVAEPRHQLAILRAQEQERARLANELHDGPAQALANLIFQIEIVERAVARDAADGQRELRSLRLMLAGELDTVRAYINQLRPPLADSDGLDDALREAAQRLTEHDGVPVDLNLQASAELIDETARSVALRIAQEALRNISKHAGARRAWLTTHIEHDAGAPTAGVSDQPPVWVMEIGDDGRGFDIDAVGGSSARRHFGLRFMRERSDLLGARLSIESRPNAGTVIRLSIEARGKGNQSA
jgi:two-component system, NarL family, sensor histidine kinase DegS